MMRIGLCLLLFVLAGGSRLSGDTGKLAERAQADREKIEGIVNDFRARLSMPQTITVSIVPTNPLLVSVEPLNGREGPFSISVENGFLDLLNDDELKAVVAHELGHVWIFTHHPYLQTERLANQIAMRLVTRDSLTPVYEKVFKREGTQGDLAQFLGDEPKAPANHAEASPR